MRLPFRIPGETPRGRVRLPSGQAGCRFAVAVTLRADEQEEP